MFKRVSSMNNIFLLKIFIKNILFIYFDLILIFKILIKKKYIFFLYKYFEGEDERLHISPSAVKLIMNYLHHYGYDNSVEVIKNETGIGANTANYKTLKQLLNKKDFKNAIIFTK